MVKMSRGVIATGLSSMVALAALTGSVAAPAALAGTAGTAKPKNVNFVGTWTPDTGVGWTVTQENVKTGKCSGYSALKSSGYGFVGCQITGSHYRFVVTYGSGYRSVNTGTIAGNMLSGSFNDGRGGSPYTAVRTKH